MVVMVVRAWRGGRIAIIINGEQGDVGRVVIVMVLGRQMVMTVVVIMIMIRKIDREGTREGVGRVGLTARVQGPIDHGDRRLNHEHGDQHHGQSRHAFPKPIVQMLKQGSLDRVTRCGIVVASSAQINALRRPPDCAQSLPGKAQRGPETRAAQLRMLRNAPAKPLQSRRSRLADLLRIREEPSGCFGSVGAESSETDRKRKCPRRPKPDLRLPSGKLTW